MGIFDFFKKKPKPAKKVEPLKVESVKKAVPKKKAGDVYKILKQPHISEKATQLSDKNKYAFKVYAWANKEQIKKAIKDLYGVRVKDINIINIKPKTRTLRNIEGTKTGYKKAIVTLEQGDKIEIMPH